MATKFNTGKVRLSYLFALEPKVGKMLKSGQVAASRYGAMIIFPKSDKITEMNLRNAIQEAFIEGKADLGVKSDKIPFGMKIPIHDGDLERPEDPACANSWFFNCSSNSRPEVCDRKLQIIDDPDEIYSGMYARVSVTIKAYNNEGKGITAYLNNIQKVSDGDRLDGKSGSVSDFNDGTEWTNAEFNPDEEDDDDMSALLGTKR